MKKAALLILLMAVGLAIGALTPPLPDGTSQRFRLAFVCAGFFISGLLAGLVIRDPWLRRSRSTTRLQS